MRPRETGGRFCVGGFLQTGAMMAIQKLCCHHGCDDLALQGKSHCALHEERRKAKADARKAKAKQSAKVQARAALYGERRWKDERRSFLERNPLCVDCNELGLVVAANEVDHIKPHRGDRTLFYDRNNWQALCKSCHSRKTAQEIFGHRGVS